MSLASVLFNGPRTPADEVIRPSSRLRLSEVLEKFKPRAVWLFAPRHGQAELDEWAKRIREVSRETKIWIQVPSVADAVGAMKSEQKPDVLVVQGADAGGHSEQLAAVHH